MYGLFFLFNLEVDLVATYISASVLGADLMNLSAECRRLEENGIDMLHFDVMDGHFVNNISFGLPVLQALNRNTDLFMDVHLMISEPLKYISEFVNAGSDMITFHIESDSDPDETIDTIKKFGIKAGISVKPATPLSTVLKYISKVDMVLIMTVEPGFGGQKFIPEMAEKVRFLREYITDNKLKTDIEVDGGINDKTADMIKKAGANILVSGSYLFNAPSMSEAVEKLK